MAVIYTENMPIEELLKHYAGYSSERQVSDGDAASASRKKLRSSSTQRGYTCHKLASSLLSDIL